MLMISGGSASPLQDPEQGNFPFGDVVCYLSLRLLAALIICIVLVE